MKKVWIYFIPLLIICTGFVSARDLSVDYLDGYVDVKSGGDWSPLYIGDTITDSDVIRLSEKGYVELTMDDVKITLDKDGVYDVSKLVGQLEKAGKWGLQAASLAKLLKSDEAESRQSSVMGVRGDIQDAEDVTWVDDDAEFLEQGKALYEKGQYQKAMDTLGEGAEWYGSNYDEILYYKALCELQTGKSREMRESLSEINPSPEDDFYENYVILYGNLLIESQDYSEADTLFNTYLDESKTKTGEQTVILLSAFCAVQLGDLDGAKTKLQKAIDLNPGSKEGKKAADLLNSI